MYVAERILVYFAAPLCSLRQTFYQIYNTKNKKWHGGRARKSGWLHAFKTLLSDATNGGKVTPKLACRAFCSSAQPNVIIVGCVFVANLSEVSLYVRDFIKRSIYTGPRFRSWHSRVPLLRPFRCRQAKGTG